MKTSTRIGFAAILAASVIVAFCVSAFPPKQVVQTANRNDWAFELKIQKTSQQDYVPVDKKKFDDALCDLDNEVDHTGKKKGEYSIKFKANPHASETPDYHPTCTLSPNVRTEKITRSGVAETSAAGASAANDPNATQHVRVNRAQDLEGVLAAFVGPSPTPTPTP